MKNKPSKSKEKDKKAISKHNTAATKSEKHGKETTPANIKKKSLKDSISIKETLILIIGIVVIFSLFLIIPNLFEEEPKTLDELHAENYNMPPSEENYVYNGFSFLKMPDPRTSREFWYTQYRINDTIFNIPFHYGPREVNNITRAVLEPLERKDYKGMYMTIDPKNYTENRPYLTLAFSEFSEKILKVKRYPIMSACTLNITEACQDRPIANCTNAEDFIVVYFKDEGETAVITEGNCITVQGTNESLIKATDRLLLELLGIMTNE
jgi:hypothetical protein